MFLRCALIVLFVFGTNQIKSDLLGDLAEIFINFKYYLKIVKDLPTLANCPPDECTQGKQGYGSQTLSVGSSESYAPHYVGIYITLKTGQQAFCGGFLFSTAEISCGGVINLRYVLTAAHCLENATSVDLVMGRYDYSDDTETEYCDFPVSSADFMYHEDWTLDGFKNDIGIIRVRNPTDIICIDESPHTKPITLASEEDSLKNRIFTMSGRGVRGLLHPSKVQNIARCVTLPYLSQETCHKFMTNPDKQFCAGCKNRAACAGDSGSAAISRLTSGLKAFGIVSAGYNPCDIGLPTLFTDIRGFLPWIHEFVCEEIQ